MTFDLLKSFHIIGVVCWFAGLFYLVRLFIYDIEASHKDELHKAILQKQFRIMQKRLWLGITVPSMVITLVCGSYLLWKMPYLLAGPNYWMHLKLLLVLLLVVYHFRCGTILKELKMEKCQRTSKQLRVFNEIATLLLCGIIFAVVMRSIFSVFAATSVILFLGIIYFTVYSKIRNKAKD